MKNKGFTMVELLVSIIIFSLLTSVAIIAINGVLEKSRESYYEKQENLLVLAGKDYFTTNPSRLPKKIGRTQKITLRELIEGKYIDPVFDRNKNTCDIDASYVSVRKVNETEYKYRVYLLCPKDPYESKKYENDSNVGSITFGPNESTDNKPIIVTMTIEGNDIASYQYRIRNITTGTSYDSPNKPYKVPVDIVLTEEGEYEIVGYGYDKNGEVIEETSGRYIISGLPPTCGEVIGGGSSTTWINQSRTISVGCNSASGSCTQASFSKTFDPANNTAQTTGSIIITDKAGNERECIVNVYIDKIPPTAPTSASLVFGDWTPYTHNTWTKNDVYAAKNTTGVNGPAGSTDAHSGVEKYQISSNNTTWADYVYSSSGALYKMDTEGTHTRYFRAVDYAGNVSAVFTRTILIDKTAPTCGAVNYIDPAGSGWSNWTARRIGVACSKAAGKAPCTTDGSNVVYQYPAGKTYTSGTATIKDTAGNTRTCAFNPKIDTEPPYLEALHTPCGVGCGLAGSRAYVQPVYRDNGAGLGYREARWATGGDAMNNGPAIGNYGGLATASDCMATFGSRIYGFQVYLCDTLNNCTQINRTLTAANQSCP